MQSAALLLGFLAVGACSIDHVVVAALDGAAGTNTIESAGSSGQSASASGSVSSGGSRAQGGDRFILSSGGANVDIRLDGDAGATPVVICSCLGPQQGQACGSDGITYPTECDEDGGTCVPPAISCWHACPCLEGETADVKATTWFTSDCVATAQCQSDVVCLTFTNATLETQGCAPAGN